MPGPSESNISIVRHCGGFLPPSHCHPDTQYPDIPHRQEDHQQSKTSGIVLIINMQGMLDMHLKLIDNQVTSDISLIDCDMLSGLGWISK